MILDTLAYAGRLREAGFSEWQADGLAHALAASLTDSLATQQDLRERQPRNDARFAQTGAGTRPFDGYFARIDARFDALGVRLDARFDALGERLDARFDALGIRLDARFDALGVRLDARFDRFDRAMEERFAALGERMDARFAKLISRVDLVDFERRMTMRLGGIMVASVVFFSALNKLL